MCIKSTWEFAVRIQGVARSPSLFQPNFHKERRKRNSFLKLQKEKKKVGKKSNFEKRKRNLKTDSPLLRRKRELDIIFSSSRNWTARLYFTLLLLNFIKVRSSREVNRSCEVRDSELDWCNSNAQSASVARQPKAAY